MSFYNGILNHEDNHESSPTGQTGPRGLPGVGFKVDANGNYDIENKKLTNVQNGDMDHDVMVKSQIEGYVSTNYVKKTGDTMTGPLIIPKDSFPIQGDLNKVISYELQREVFLSKKEGGRMEQPIDMNGFSIDNLKAPISDDNPTTKGYADNNFLNRLTGGSVGGDLDLRGHTIKYLKFDKDDHAAARVAELNLKADKSDLDDYIKLDGSKAMMGNLNMNNNRINNLPFPASLNEPTTLGFVNQLNNNLFGLYLDLEGVRKMKGDLNMDNHMITNVKTPLNDSDAVTKGYLDTHSIQPSHPLKNVFEYIMNDVNQTSSEYGIVVDKIDNHNDSFHSYNKKVIYLKLLKDGNNYRARIGYNIFKLIDKSKDKYYTAVIEWLTTDNNAWNKMQIFNNITSGSIISNQTRKFEDGKGLYYTRSIIQFEVMAISTAPLYLLSTIHIDGVNPTYPAKFSEVYNIIYGIDGSHTAISPEVYNQHKAFEIDKTKMKMLVPLDMNGKQLMNVNLNLKFSNIFKIIKCDTTYSSNKKFFITTRKDNHHIFSSSAGVFITSITFHNKQTFNNNAAIKFIGNGLGSDHEIKLSPLVIDTGLVRKLNIWLEFNSGFRIVRFMNLTNNLRFPFDVDFVLSDM